MGILEVIRTDKNIKRIFGKRELVIIEKQLLGVRLKPSEKTRLSRDIRKKFEAINALTPFAKEFKLKHGTIIKSIIDEAKEAILASKYFPKIKKILLFGSAAENNLNLLSDIDLAVEFTKIAKKKALQFRLEILKKVNEKMDIQVYNLLPNKIKKEIDIKGKAIYER